MKIETSELWVVCHINRGPYDWNTEVPVTVFTTKEEADAQATFLNGPWYRRGLEAQYETKRLDNRVEDIIYNAMAAAEYSDGE